MEFIASLFTAIFADNIITYGKGIKDAKELRWKKHSWILFVLFLVEAVILGGAAIGLRALGKNFDIFQYLSFLILVLLMVLITGGFYLLLKVFPEEIRQGLSHQFVSVTINSALLAIAASLFFAADMSNLKLVGLMLGLPLGFLVSTYVIAPLYDRVDSDDAMKGFRGLPLLLLVLAGLVLSLSALKF